MASKTTATATPATFPCRADNCKLPNLAPTHRDGLCKLHRDAYKAGTFRINAQTPEAARAYLALKATKAPKTKAVPKKVAAKPTTRKASTPPTPAKVARQRVPAQPVVAPVVAKVADAG